MILLVPGFGGSKIYCECERGMGRMYPNFRISLHDHFFECTQTRTRVRKSIFSLSIYKKFLKFCDSAFAYDWRRTPLENAVLLKCELESVDGDIVLVGHSMGGLIIRILIEYLNYTENIKSVFICGTPLYGSVSYVDYNMEYNLYTSILKNNCGEVEAPFTFSKSDKYRFFQHCIECLKYLMPSFTVFGKCNVLEFDEKIVDVHKHLSNFNFHNIPYYFYYNVSRSVRRRNISLCNYKSRHPISNFSSVKYIEGNIMKTNELVSSDGLVVAPSSVSRVPATIYFDSTLCIHSLMMNKDAVLYIARRLEKDEPHDLYKKKMF